MAISDLTHKTTIFNETMQEIEVKAKVSEADFNHAQARLATIAFFKGKTFQKERYLNNPDRPFYFKNKKGLKDANEYLRIREEEGESTICFKKVHRDPTGKRIFCHEYEFKIEEPEKALYLFNYLGFSEVTNVEKTRERYDYLDYEISLDRLQGLGCFIEVELKGVREKPISEVLEELEQVLSDVLEIKEYRVQAHGYLTMIWNLDFFGEMLDDDA